MIADPVTLAPPREEPHRPAARAPRDAPPFPSLEDAASGNAAAEDAAAAPPAKDGKADAKTAARTGKEESETPDEDTPDTALAAAIPVPIDLPAPATTGAPGPAPASAAGAKGAAPPLTPEAAALSPAAAASAAPASALPAADSAAAPSTAATPATTPPAAPNQGAQTPGAVQATTDAPGAASPAGGALPATGPAADTGDTSSGNPTGDNARQTATSQPAKAPDGTASKPGAEAALPAASALADARLNAETRGAARGTAARADSQPTIATDGSATAEPTPVLAANTPGSNQTGAKGAPAPAPAPSTPAAPLASETAPDGGVRQTDVAVHTRNDRLHIELSTHDSGLASRLAAASDQLVSDLKQVGSDVEAVRVAVRGQSAPESANGGGNAAFSQNGQRFEGASQFHGEQHDNRGTVPGDAASQSAGRHSGRGSRIGGAGARHPSVDRYA